MTREEAIKRLNWVREQIDEKPIHYTHQALDMAIKALNVPDINIGDMISRQAAIDTLGEEPEVRSDNDQYDLGLNNQWWDDVNAIKGLPPAQQNRIARETAGKSPDEIYDFLHWLLIDYGRQFTDSRLAVIEWLKEERR